MNSRDLQERAVVVLDVGKTLSKASLWTRDGRLLDRRTRQNERIQTPDYVGLDAAGIEAWLAATLTDFAQEFAGTAEIGWIIPVGHGAAAAVVRDGALVQPPLDYEHPIPRELRKQYDSLRGSFASTGSPALPNGLNLGAQLYYLQSLRPDLLSGNATLLPWPQYWSWLLCGVPASEVSSLGCHSDLWQPLSGQPSVVSVARGWAAHMAPLTRAGSILGPITPEWAARTGLPADVQVLCGLHDSNAALLAARAFPELIGSDATILSTGTWFVAMRLPREDATTAIAGLVESRDCLVNVDVFGHCVPSARFMGGREIELLTGIDSRRVDTRADQPALLESVGDVLANSAMVLPTLAPGFGPYPQGQGRWVSLPPEQTQRRAAVCLYAALVADVSLDLIGASGRLLIEGRFAESEVFVRALANLRPETAVYTGHARSDVSFGALRLLNPSLPPPASLVRVEPLPHDLNDYRKLWRDLASHNASVAA